MPQSIFEIDLNLQSFLHKFFNDSALVSLSKKVI